MVPDWMGRPTGISGCFWLDEAEVLSESNQKAWAFCDRDAELISIRGIEAILRKRLQVRLDGC